MFPENCCHTPGRINMHFVIRYAALSFTGQVRMQNEDNYCVQDRILPLSHEEGIHLLTGEADAAIQPVFGIFDGMGGERAGAEASYTAANSFLRQTKNRAFFRRLFLSENYISSVCLQMNRDVVDFAEKEKIRSTGSTAAILCFSSRKAFWANLGDSRIFRITPDTICQLSTDHTASGSFLKKGPLTQYLGIREADMHLDPAVSSEVLVTGTSYLLCSDGLTDLVTEQELYQTVMNTSAPADAVSQMENLVKNRGAVDNTTIILCRII